MLHPLLERHLRRAGLGRETTPVGLEQWQGLLERISRAYSEADDNRYLLTRSLSISSREMEDLHSKLAAERDRLGVIVESLGEGLCALDGAGVVLLINSRAQQLLGVGGDVGVGVHHGKLFRLYDPEASSLEELLRSGSAHDANEATLESRTGVRRIVSYSLSPLVVNGLHSGSVLTFRDASERKRVEEMLRESEKRLRLFVENAPAAIAMFDREMRYLGVSLKWIEDFELAGEALIGRSHYDVFPELPERWKEVNRRCLAGASEECEHDRFERANGRVEWLRWKVIPWRGADGTVQGIIIFSELITGRIEAEAELARAKRAAETANRAKSEFLANLSHEIRTPLAALLGYADLLAEDGVAPEVRLDHVRTIQRNGDHLLALINDTLDLSKVEAGEMTVERIPCSPEQVIADVASLMRERAVEKGLEFEVDYRSTLPHSIRTDPTRLRQVLMNLVGNAIKFTDQGGVRIVASLTAIAPSMATTPDSLLRIDVADTGIGMTPEQTAKLFRPFMQADSSVTRRFGGTGLGLAVSARLAGLLGGAIRVASTPGEGSTFTLELAVERVEPSDAVRVAGAATGAVPSGARPLAGTCVLLAEDGPDNRRLISFHLEKAGAAVSVTENGRLACERVLEAASSGRPFDLDFMDMQMPEMDGYTATRELRRLGYAGPVVALTAHALAEDRARCLAAGCSEYAVKPIQAPALVALARRCLDAARSGDESAQRAGPGLEPIGACRE